MVWDLIGGVKVGFLWGFGEKKWGFENWDLGNNGRKMNLVLVWRKDFEATMAAKVAIEVKSGF